ncbi:hypothetical protein C4E24_06535 [ANME-1 cluster archaeon AG-394-G21]|nr:hypothetical protein [ANME-1 cluster archaeon AG-394-G21]
MDDDSYNAIIVACVIGIAITLVFVMFMRAEIMSEEGFTELYFGEHRKLPIEMEINESYNVSFTLTNHELETTKYIFEVDSKIEKFKENITLLPGESAVFTLSITPTDKGWELFSSIAQGCENKLDILKDSVLARENEFRLIIDNISHRYVPISHQVDRFGYVFHTNLSVDELKEKQFNKCYSYKDVGINKSVRKEQTVTISVKNNEIYLSSNQSEEIYLSERSPFIIKAYRYDEDLDKELEIHFWYEVR